NMIFLLEPYAGDDPGWTIRLAPAMDPQSRSVDCSGAVSESLHGNKNLSLDPPDSAPQGVTKWKPREFDFVSDAANCKVAWELMNLVYYPSKLIDEERAEAGEKLGKIPTGHGKLTIVDSRLTPSAGIKDGVEIEWLKFEVELNFPAL